MIWRGVRMGIFDFLKKKPEVKPYQNSNGISFGSNPQQKISREASEIEEDELIKLREMILKNRNLKFDIEIQHKSKDYTTIRYRNMDMARLAWTVPYHHIKIGIYNQEMYDKYVNSDMFRSQKKKNEVMWSSHFAENNIEKYYPVILELFDVINSADYTVKLREQEEAYMKMTAQVLRNVMGPEGKLYVSKTNENIRIHHELSDVEVEFRPYKKKPWRITCGRRDEEYNLLKKYKLYTGNKREFTGLLELDSLDAISSFEPIFRERYEYFQRSDYSYPPTKEALSFYTELPY